VRSHRVVFYDQRGTGDSDRLQVSTRAPDLARLSLRANVDDLEQLRNRLGRDKVALIGHSWGAALAVFYAAAYPQHVDKLIVYSGGPETRDLSARKAAAHTDKLTQAERSLLETRMAALKAALAAGAAQDELDRLFGQLAQVMFPSLYCRRPSASGHDDLGRGGFWANRAAGAYSKVFTYDSIAAGLRALRAPTLLIWGRCEPSPRERLTNLQAYIRGARFVVFENSGHNAMEEERELFFAVLRAFLEGRALPARASASRPRGSGP
jgi:proline iminopeptidase